jgi:hypothetical protein
MVRGSKLKPYCPSKEGERGVCGGFLNFSKKIAKVIQICSKKKFPKFSPIFFKKK